MSKQGPKTVADLQKMADDAAAFNKALDTLLQSIASVERRWVEQKFDQNFPAGALGFYAKLMLHGEKQHPDNPILSKAGYMASCERTYDVLKDYFNAQEKENADETEPRPHGPRTRG